MGEKWVVVSQRSRAQQMLVTYALPPGGGMPQELANGNKVVFDEPAYTLSGGEGTTFINNYLVVQGTVSMHSPKSRTPLSQLEHMWPGKAPDVHLIVRGQPPAEHVSFRLDKVGGAPHMVRHVKHVTWELCEA